jgi:hypothetical protein
VFESLASASVAPLTAKEPNREANVARHIWRREEEKPLNECEVQATDHTRETGNYTFL